MSDTTPATFSLSGLRATRDGYTHVTVTWSNGGSLSGDADAVAAVTQLAQEYEGRTLRPIVGPMTITHHLESPYTAYLLMKSIFKPGTTTQTGSLPPIDLPPGAIA